MKFVDLSFADPACDLACDEALLDRCEADGVGAEVLRIWEPADYFVVLGYSNRVAREVAVDTCAARGMPIFRRFSGGGAVLQGPGCLNYTLVLRNERAEHGDVVRAFRRVLEPHREIVSALSAEPVEIAGISDLAVAGRKFSGNSQHRKRACTLFHGTFLLSFDLSMIESFLPMPSRAPAYRGGRDHGDFLRNVSLAPARLRDALRERWRADEAMLDFPGARLEDLLRTRYSRREWNAKY